MYTFYIKRTSFEFYFIICIDVGEYTARVTSTTQTHNNIPTIFLDLMMMKKMKVSFGSSRRHRLNIISVFFSLMLSVCTRRIVGGAGGGRKMAFIFHFNY